MMGDLFAGRIYFTTKKEQINRKNYTSLQIWYIYRYRKIVTFWRLYNV
jgi:hypothetical protein